MVTRIERRIIVINNLYPPQELGGYGRSIFDFAQSLQSRGHKIQVLTSDAPYLYEIKQPETNIDRRLLLYGSYEELPPKCFEDSKETLAVIQHNINLIDNHIGTYHPDIVLIGNIDFLGIEVCKPFLEHNIPVIHHLGFKAPSYSIISTPNSPLYHLSTASQFVKEQVQNLGYPLNDISVVYPGARVDQYKMPVLPNLEKLRISYASLVLKSKGIHTLIEALGILHDEGFDFECKVAGDTPVQDFLNQLKSFVSTKGMEDKIELLGYLNRPQLIELFGRSNVLVFPSVSEEAFGISQVEGMAAGLALITSATGGAAEIVEHGISGITFPPEDALALARALVSLLQDRQKWEEIAKTGEKRAREKFDIERSVDQLEEKFAELLVIRDSGETIVHKKNQTQLQQSLSLREINLILFPDWNAEEETLLQGLGNTLKTISNHPKAGEITLLLDLQGMSPEDADLALSSAVMNLMMEEGIELREDLEVSPVGELNRHSWETLLSLVDGRISLETEKLDRVTEIGTEKLPVYTLESLSKESFIPKQEQDQIKAQFSLRAINLILFPDWNAEEETLLQALGDTLKTISDHPQAGEITLLLDLQGMSPEDADLALSSAVMNLMMEEGIELRDDLEVSPVGELDRQTWETLLSLVDGRISLETEKLDRVTEIGAEKLPIYTLDSFSKDKLSNIMK